MCTNVGGLTGLAHKAVADERGFTVRGCSVSALMQLGYTFDEKQIARDFWYFLRQFYAKYPKYAKLDLYLIGESYGEQ